ncbi:MAG: hypothetical protein KC619_32850 [Myxococcales bacterium]|nr:hypothetical protein [Myxococcales bacterium]
MSAPHPVLTTPSGLSARAERLDGLDVLAIRDGDGRLVLRVDAETGQVIAAAEQTLPKADTIELSQDLLEVKSKWGAAARSAVLPGWGQVYNGDTGRGIVYGAVFAAVAAGAVASAVLGANAEDSYNENTPDTVDDRSTANDHYQRANWLLVGMGAVWAINIVDAYLTGTNAELVKVSGSAGVGGAQLGLGFTF